MSGGVDSSVAAALLLEQGFDVIGVTMRLWTVEGDSGPRSQRRCCSVEDTDDARNACDQLGIRHYVLNYEEPFGVEVVDYFVREYSLGRTPNPCLACNQYIKFAPLLKQALALDAKFLATGHYVRLRRGEDGFQLWQAVDTSKDQSYVLYTLGQQELSHTLFPLGDYPKSEVRRLARDFGLSNSDKPDSVDICFVQDGDYRDFVGERVKASEGDIVDSSGNLLGHHGGVINYTVGQRRGLPARGGSQPLYVIGLDAETSTVVVGDKEELMVDRVIIEAVSFVSGQPPDGEVELEAKIRYGSSPAPARFLGSGSEAEVKFSDSQRGASPGQAIVFYHGERLLGGGVIKAVL